MTAGALDFDPDAEERWHEETRDLPFDAAAADAWHRDHVAPFEANDEAPQNGASAAVVRDDDDDAPEPFAWDDLEEILNGTYERPKAGVLHRDDGRGLFYPARFNMIFGEDGIGKTHVELVAAAAVLRAGGVVFHLNYDGDAAEMVDRLRVFGATDDEIRNGYRHKTDPGVLYEEIVAEIVTQIPADRPCLILIDVVADALAAHGYDEDKAGQFLRWVAYVVRPLTRAGACVIAADHVVKSNEGGGHSRGSGAKRGKVDGVSFELTAPTPLMPGERGVLALTVWKDRNGAIGRRGTLAARLLFTPTSATTYDIRVCVPLAEQANAQQRRADLSAHMEHVSDVVAEHPGIGVTDLIARANIGERPVRAALGALTDEGWIAPQGGETGRRKEHYKRIPYRADRDPRSPRYSVDAVAEWRTLNDLPPYPPQLDDLTHEPDEPGQVDP